MRTFRIIILRLMNSDWWGGGCPAVSFFLCCVSSKIHEVFFTQHKHSTVGPSTSHMTTTCCFCLSHDESIFWNPKSSKVNSELSSSWLWRRWSLQEGLTGILNSKAVLLNPWLVAQHTTHINALPHVQIVCQLYLVVVLEMCYLCRNSSKHLGHTGHRSDKYILWPNIQIDCWSSSFIFIVTYNVNHASNHFVLCVDCKSYLYLLFCAIQKFDLV